MTLFPAAVVIVVVAIVGAAFALATFFWALRSKQFSIRHLNEGATVIFDSAEDIGKPTDQLFKKPAPNTDERTGH